MYVVFEGIDGAGKSTQIKLVQKELQKKANDRLYEKLKIINIAETEIGEKTTKLPNTESTLIYALKRIDFQPLIIKNNHNIILSDRSYISSIAYQGLSNRTYVENVNSFCKKPDLLFTFITDPSNDYLEQVQQNYIQITERIENNTFLDTTILSIKETTDKIWRTIWNKWEEEYKQIYLTRSYYDDSS